MSLTIGTSPFGQQRAGRRIRRRRKCRLDHFSGDLRPQQVGHRLDREVHRLGAARSVCVQDGGAVLEGGQGHAVEAGGPVGTEVS